MKRGSKHKLVIGTSGFNYKDWKGRFYPENLPQKEWLSYYAGHFDTVEINNSFYSPIKKETFEKWYTLTPENFTFVIKGHRLITQLKKLNGVEEPVRYFFGNAAALGQKLSCVLWQFPASFRLQRESGKVSTFGRLEKFLTILPISLRHAFEFRDKSWFIPEVNDLLRQYNASFVISQSAVFPQAELLNGNFAYIRFHGPGALYSSGYSDDELLKWAGKISEYVKTMDVYCYFNNDASSLAINNAIKLRRILTSL